MNSLGNVLYLSRAEIDKLKISMSKVIEVVEEAFREKAEGKVETPPKPGVHPHNDAFIHAMLAYIRKMQVAGVKWVTGFPENPKRGLPYISGLLILNDVETGFPICVMDSARVLSESKTAP